MNVEFYTGVDERLEVPRILPPAPDFVDLARRAGARGRRRRRHGAHPGVPCTTSARARSARCVPPRSTPSRAPWSAPTTCGRDTERWITFPWSDRPPVTGAGRARRLSPAGGRGWWPLVVHIAGRRRPSSTGRVGLEVMSVDTCTISAWMTCSSPRAWRRGRPLPAPPCVRSAPGWARCHPRLRPTASALDLVAEIERLKATGAAAQARLTHAVRQSREAIVGA